MEKQSLLSIEELFKKSWEIFHSNWKIFVGISLAWWLIFILPFFFFKLPHPSLLHFELNFFYIILFLIFLFLTYLWIALCLIIVVRDRKEKIGIREIFQRSRSKIFDFFMANLLSGLIILAGFLFLIIPGIVFWIYLSLVPFVLVCENIKGGVVLKQSWRLVKNHWWEIFAKLLILIIATFALSWISSIFNIIFDIFIFPLRWLLPVFYEAINGVTDFIFKILPSVIAFPFGLIYTYIIYEDLKKIKES
jgi:hypothetical protein